MNRSFWKKIHPIVAVLATLCIACFWFSTVISELFLSHEAVLVVKQSILYGFILLIPSMMLTGISGMKLGGKSKNPLILAKKRECL